MRLSKYSVEIEISNCQYILYNTLSRRYYMYSNKEKDALWELLLSLDKRKSFSIEETELLKELAQKEIIVDDEIDELRKLEYLENSCWYQNATYHLTIFSTNACNFRCTYCTQDHIVKNIEESVIENVISLIINLSKYMKRLHITWFGGEPLLQYQKIMLIMKKAIQICEDNQCDLQTDFVTNGYLLNNNIVKDMIEMHTRSLQITVDSAPEIHDRRRMLKNGSGTYEKILQNLITVLKHGISTILRINIDEETFLYPVKILEDIPNEYRGLVTISISNLFQKKDRCSAYDIFLKAIRMGYKYGERENDYYGCKTCGNRNIVIDTDGNILFCTNVTLEEGVIGKLSENGKITYFNREKYRQNIMKSARENESCRECIELPFCIGRCRLTRTKEEHKCLGRANVGLSLEERAKLDFYYDQVKKGEYIV